MHAARLIPLVLVGCGVGHAEPPRVYDICTGFAEPVQDGKLRDRQLDEVSGLVVHDGVRWVHNDSGDTARVFALDADGATVAVVSLAGVEARDWEDMALGAGPGGGPHLYLGDIGDNLEVRDGLVVHRLAVPSPVATAELAADSFAVRYPDGAHNAETLLIDPTTGELVVVTKSDSGQSAVYRATLPENPGPVVLERSGALTFPEESRGTEKATAGDIRGDGARIAIRTYTDLWLWERGDESVSAALARPPCRLPLVKQPQGEALAFDGADLLTVSEGAGQPFWRYRAASTAQ